MPVIQWRRHSAAESSMLFAGHQRRLCLRGTLLPAGLLDACCHFHSQIWLLRRNESHIIPHPTWGAEMNISLLLFTARLISPFLNTGELQSGGSIRWNLSLCPGHAASGYRQWCWFHSVSDFTRLRVISQNYTVSCVRYLNTADMRWRVRLCLFFFFFALLDLNEWKKKNKTKKLEINYSAGGAHLNVKADFYSAMLRPRYLGEGAEIFKRIKPNHLARCLHQKGLIALKAVSSNASPFRSFSLLAKGQINNILHSKTRACESLYSVLFTAPNHSLISVVLSIIET